MSTLAHEIMLVLAGGQAISGRWLAQQLGCTRAAVWKQIQTLRATGLEIDASSGVGYRLQQPLDPLDAGAIWSALRPDVAQRLQHLQCLPRCHSTNAVLATQREPGVACCVSEYQFAGRGRRGQQWCAPAYGSLLLSLRWEFDCGANTLALMGVRAGLLLRATLQDCGADPLALKWPNDVVAPLPAGPAKLAGILIEMQGSMDGPCQVIVGIGVNVSWPPACLQQLRRQLQQQPAAHGQPALPPVDLRTLGVECSRNLLAATLINRLVDLCEQQAQTPAAVDDLLANWRQHDVLYDKRVQVVDNRTGAVLVTAGIGAGIDASGAYQVQSGERTDSFNATSISLRPLPSVSA